MNLLHIRITALIITIAILTLVALTNTASAMCPLCTAGAAIGLGIARYYGVDDIIIGLWLGALAVSTALWLSDVVKKRIKHSIIPFQETLVVLAVIASTIVPFYLAGFFNGMPSMPSMVDTIFGINRVAFGTVIGGFVMFVGAPLSSFIKRKRMKAFPFQTIILTLLLLIVLSAFFWYVTKYYHIV